VHELNVRGFLIPRRPRTDRGFMFVRFSLLVEHGHLAQRARCTYIHTHTHTHTLTHTHIHT
jgi:hypothetical protein